MTGRGSGRTIRQGLQRQLVEAGDFDGWPAGATGGSYLPDIAGKETCETTKAECPAAWQNKIIEMVATFYYLS